jgi:hypothetical protein
MMRKDCFAIEVRAVAAPAVVVVAVPEIASAAAADIDSVVAEQEVDPALVAVVVGQAGYRYQCPCLTRSPY